MVIAMMSSTTVNALLSDRTLKRATPSRLEIRKNLVQYAIIGVLIRHPNDPCKRVE